MKIKKDDVLKQDLSFFDTMIGDYPYLRYEKEHYKLLTYIGNSYNGITILDAGTCNGLSCMALAENPNNHVITYDIIDKDLPVFSKENVTFKKLDINKEDAELVMSSSIIMLDIDPHDGIQETVFIKYLKEIKYKGYVICDDISLSTEMKSWWASVDVEKYDVSEVGHFSGTGIINFNEDGNFTYE
jgi:predicted O-methyltransferase YrrM